MRDFPVAITRCEHCGKRISLYDDDFFVVLDDSPREWHEYYYVCPECGEAGKHPGSLMPTYLKDRLVMAEKRRSLEKVVKTRLLKIPLIFGLIIIGFFVLLTLIVIFQ